MILVSRSYFVFPVKFSYFPEHQPVSLNGLPYLNFSDHNRTNQACNTSGPWMKMQPVNRDLRLGGVTTICSYFRTGKNYLNKSGPYHEIFPEVLEKSKNSFYTDFAYHLTIMTPDQMNEIERLVTEHGVSTFKYFMFYKMLDLTGAAGSDKYLMHHDIKPLPMVMFSL
jgi:hypothetical protein